MERLNPNKNLSVHRSKLQPRWSIVRIVLILLLSTLVIFGAAPGYLPGKNWSWVDVPRVANLSQVKQVLSSGLILTDWQTIDRQELKVGGQKWLAQLITQEDSKPVMLLLLPQSYYLDKPEVEWMDINGLERWKSDSYGQLNLTINHNQDSFPITARFFRAWTNKQTFAVVQWYAFPGGGHYAPANWFGQDLLAQLRGNRVPWVAVCLKIPIEPLGELTQAQPLAQSLAKQVQVNLQKSAFSKPS